MWRTVLVLPLCTLIVAVFCARSTSAHDGCKCGGPSETSPGDFSQSFNSGEICTVVAETDCHDPEPYCHCSSATKSVIDLNDFANSKWWCQHNNVGECVGCTKNDHCTEAGEICCPVKKVCEVPIPNSDPAACGDPHMTGFLGQKFDFTGEDGAWYCLVNDGPSMHLNMRVTAPVPAVPQITYITGLSVITTDVQGVDHTIEITVSDPHNMDTSCPEGSSPCLADGALTVELDGQESLTSPGEVILGPGVAVSAVNLPGACRSFGFEKYWEHKKLQNAGGDRRLDLVGSMQDMGEWILADPTATNMDECTEYVAVAGETGLFEHESEHASFQITTPTGTIRLSHGRLHQLAMRDPTDQYDLPDHLAWQMNVAIDHHDVSHEATGVLGETVVPTVDANGDYIMKGLDAIRGVQEDYRVTGPLDTAFAQGRHLIVRARGASGPI